MKRSLCKRKAVMWLLMLFILCLSLQAGAVQIVQTDVTTAPEGSFLLGFEGKYITEVDAALKLINSYRLEAYNEGLVDSYVPIKWSSDLEYIARIRAAESMLTMGHVRTNGTECSDISGPDGLSTSGENLAWNFSESMLDAIKQWYTEKNDYVNHTGGETGHYTSMISPGFVYVGLGSFCSGQSKTFYNCTAAEFGWSYKGTVSTKPLSNPGNVIQMLEVPAKEISGLAISGDTSGDIASTHTMKLKVDVGTGMLNAMTGVNWSSSNPNVASVSSNGILTAKTCGKTTVSAGMNGKSASLAFSVNHKWNGGSVKQPATYTKAGTMIYTCQVCGAVRNGTLSKLKTRTIVDTVNNAKYKFNSKLQLQFVGPANKKLRSVTIPDTVNVDGKSYKVTAIAANAFKNNKKIEEVVIGKNIAKIGTKAFYNCRKLRSVIVKTGKLKKNHVDANAFGKINTKAVIKVPARKLKAYKTVLKKAGLPAKVTVSK